MPWRDHPTPYYVLVSEIMLQQTQVPRVMPKFSEFVAKFPDFGALAKADLGDVLRAWNGLGYNRRAKFLWEAAKIINAHGFPTNLNDLTKLPGVGINTAGAIMAYVYDQPVVFIETNIRTVFIHHFFKDQLVVDDAAIRELVQATLPKNNTRQWYWALMDYGTFLKVSTGAHLHKVKSYKRQSTFTGSNRQVRGAVLRQLTIGPLSTAQLQGTINDPRLHAVLQDLQSEGLIKKLPSGLFAI